MDTINFACPSCGQSLEIEAAQAGQLVDCPLCAQTIEVPYRSQPAQVESAPSVSPVQPPSSQRGLGGVINGLLGRASEASVDALRPEFEPMLVDGERLLCAYRLIRDLFIFTTLRLILVDKHGITGRKTEYLTIPYSSIVRFSKESAGFLDFDAELKIWVVGQAEPIVKEFRADDSVNQVFLLLSAAVLRPGSAS